jgi:hypothetical protein
MAEKKNPKPTNDQTKVDPESLRVIYDSLAAGGRTVVTFRFTVLGFFLTGVALIFAGTPSLGKYILLTLITISLWTLDLRNRTIKNDLDAQAKQIERIWGYTVNNNYDYNPYPTKVFGIITIPPKAAQYVFTHSNALDVLYFSVLLYALINMVVL